jgi:hypothetical protein
MKQKVSAPVAAAVTILVVGVLGLFLYNHYMSGPPIDTTPKGSAVGSIKPAQIPHTKEEGMAMYRNMSGGKR